jgi:hypothetical protein
VPIHLARISLAGATDVVALTCDIGELIEAITVVRRSKRRTRGWIGAMAASVLAFTYFGAHYLGVPVPWPGTNPSASQNTAAQPKPTQTQACENTGSRGVK